MDGRCMEDMMGKGEVGSGEKKGRRLLGRLAVIL